MRGWPNELTSVLKIALVAPSRTRSPHLCLFIRLPFGNVKVNGTWNKRTCEWGSMGQLSSFDWFRALVELGISTCVRYVKKLDAGVAKRVDEVFKIALPVVPSRTSIPGSE